MNQQEEDHNNTDNNNVSNMPKNKNNPHNKRGKQPSFTSEQIDEWASFGPKIWTKPSSAEELVALKERKVEVTAMKKRLAQLQEEWSERAIECELDRLVEERKKEEQPQDEEFECQQDNAHPYNRIDHRPHGGPLLEYLWCNSTNSTRNGQEGPAVQEEPQTSDNHDEEQRHNALQGQSLYLGGEVGSDGRIYCIPGHAHKVLIIDDARKQVYTVGPDLVSNGRHFKWLRGIVVGTIIYGLPCHADEVLRIDTTDPTDIRVSKLAIPYETFYKDDPVEAQRQRSMYWKYHGGTICPIDDCIYAIPQSAHHVLKIDPRHDECISLVGPSLPGRCKWYGGILGKQDGAIYGIPQNASSVLRIHPDAITLHGNFENLGPHKWHGGAAADNGVIVSVPANADTVLCITPGNPAPSLQLVGDASVIQSGRHRDDGKYKYLGAMCGTDGHVYVFPCASEYVLQVDTTFDKMAVANVGPNLRDSGLEAVHQNKWQNGLTCQDNCVYGMPLSGHTLLRVDCSSNINDDDVVTTWLLPPPRRTCRDKFEGGVILPHSGVMYTIPNNHKGVLRIEPAALSAVEASSP